jgi:hypothetical protein
LSARGDRATGGDLPAGRQFDDQIDNGFNSKALVHHRRGTLGFGCETHEQASCVVGEFPVWFGHHGTADASSACRST